MNKINKTQFIECIKQLGNKAVLISRDNDGKIEPLYVSDDYATMMETTVDEIFAQIADNRINDSIFGADLSSVKYIFEHKQSIDETCDIQIRKITSTGKIIWCNSHYAFINFKGEQLIYITYFDITALKDNESRNVALYQRARADLESVANDSLVSLRLNLTKNVVEECRGREFYPMDRKDKKISANLEDRLGFLLLQNDRQRFLNEFSAEKLIESYRNGKSLISDIFFTQRPDGRRCFVSYTATLREDPTTGDIVAFAVEKDYNDEIVNNTILHKALVEQYDMITYIVDDEYGIVIGDPERIGKGSIFPKHRRGYYDEYIENEVIPFVVDENKKTVEYDLSLEKVKAVLENKESYVRDIVCKLDGKIFNKRFVFYAVNRDADFYILLKADITAVRTEEQNRTNELRTALDQARQANAAKTAFLSNMSHEIRTPMNAIIGLNHIALKEPNLSNQTKEYLEQIGISAKHLLSMINDILNMTRIESGKMILNEEEFSLKDMLDDINKNVEQRCQAKGINYEFKFNNKLKEYYIGDSVKLKQALMNLLDNAIKFTIKGKVDFTVELDNHFENKSKLKFVVSDTGIGIDKDYLPKIFDAFSQEYSETTNSYGGSGLGLAITKNIVELMNGSIKVQSQKDVGSKFTVNVVLSEKIVDEKVAVDEDKPTDLSSKKILLAEDIEVNAEIIMMILTMKQIEVDRAENGKKVVEMFNESKVNHYDAILMDIRMPEMDGLQATKVIRKLDRSDSKTIPIIALTANAFDEDVQRSLQAGMNAHLTKPIEPEKLFDTLNELIK